MPPSPDDFDAAVEWFRSRIPMTDEEFSVVREELKHRAFSIAGIAQLDLVSDVWMALDDALSKGTTFDDFKATIGERLERAWGGEAPYRVETLFRTWVQRAYSAGRNAVMTDPTVKKYRPYWRFVAVMDSRTSPICAPLNGVVRPADDPWWASHQPPLHYSCRSTIVTLTPEEAAEEGVTDQPPPVTPSPGFGQDPTSEPPLDGYPPPLVNVLRDKKAA